MSKNDEHSGIFGGADAIIAPFFQIREGKHLKRQSVSRKLVDPGNVDGGLQELVSRLYRKIESNHNDGRMGSKQPSRENWRCKRVTTLSDHNKSPEILLERAVAMLGAAGMMPGWLNQVPVASGLINDRLDKRAALDLVKLEDGRARFVELKWGSDTPAYAAFEVLRYGLVYLFISA